MMIQRLLSLLSSGFHATGPKTGSARFSPSKTPLLSRGLLVLALGAIATTSSCGSTNVGPDRAIQMGEYFTQYPMFMEKDRLLSTNYRGGNQSILVPINSKVEVQNGKGHRVNLLLTDLGREVTFEHRKKDTQNTLGEAFAVAFGNAPVDLSGFSQAELDAIDEGRAAEGMTRSAVLIAEGPPPARYTLSMDAKIWQYREHGWNRSFEVIFGDDDTVTRITR